MTFSLQYELDYQRVISAVINDSRSVIPSLLGQDGNAVYAYSQALIAQMIPGVILYRIVYNGSNLGGVAAINTNQGAVGVVFMQERPAFVPYLVEINQFITNFIVNRTYLQDVLY